MNNIDELLKLQNNVSEIQKSLNYLIHSIKTDETFKKGLDNNSNRICEYCGKSYVYYVFRQKYCCTRCRIEAYNLRTGKRLYFKPKKT